MRSTKTIVALVVFTLLTGGQAVPAQTTPTGPGLEVAAGSRAVDLVLCLDTSGSMSGLIDAARQKLWSMVNMLALAEPTPDLRVALLTYGHPGHDAASGWVRVDSDLTRDLDAISAQLFALTTAGGTEYVGRVVSAALDELDWDEGDNVLRLIVVAGNESADQDPEIPIPDVAGRAIGREILINAIYCGNPADNIAPGWQRVARFADGQFASIDHNNGTVVVSTPFDAELASLSAAINDTYIPVGSAGLDALANQALQDSNAATMNQATAAERAVSKGGKLYRNDWDLVDATKNGTVEWDALAPEDLPEEMRAMNDEERKAYVAEKTQQREGIQKEIQELQTKRQAFIEEEKKRAALDDTKSLDHALAQAIRSQAESKGFRFEEE